jgi:hypothetical protein
MECDICGVPGNREADERFAGPTTAAAIVRESSSASTATVNSREPTSST